MDGIINIYKEIGYTSHDVVARARGILGIRKIGHTGTLDPQAEGVLPICIGSATKVSEILLNEDKRYRATVSLGLTTSTQDACGEPLKRRPVNVTRDEIKQVVASFLGVSNQIPPMYSAVRVNGKRLYELAREGKVINRKSRPIEIYQCDIVEYLSPYEFIIDVKCSKGTYIRTLCADIGDKLGTGGHMKSLLRTEVGMFKVEDSIKLSKLEDLRKSDNIEPYLIGPEEIYSDLPKLHVRPEGNNLLYNGNQLRAGLIEEEIDASFHKRVRVYDFDDIFIGIYKINKNKSNIYFTPEKMFYSPNK